MPQPFKTRPGQQVTSGASVITQRPNCATAIVQVLGSWAHFEDLMLDLFNSATARWQIVGANGGMVPISNGAALRSFKSVETLHLKHVIMSAAFRGRLSDTLIAEFESLMRQARTRVAERNDVAHALWAICDAYPNDILLRSHGEQFGEINYMRYTVNDFENITARTQALMTDAFTLTQRVRAYAELRPEGPLSGG